MDQLRVGLTRAGFTSQEERKGAVEAIVERSVTGLRELTNGEAGQLRDELHRMITSRNRSADSAWDQRDEATWIDR